MKFTTRLSAKPKRQPSDRLQANSDGRLRLRRLADASGFWRVRRVTPKQRCVLPCAVPPLASAATATRTACGKGLRLRMLGLPPARWLRLLPRPSFLASAPPGLEAHPPSLRTGLVECLVLCCALDLKLDSCVPVRFSWISGYYARSGPRCAPPSLLPFLVPAAAFSRPSFSDMYMCRVLACRRAAGEARATSTSSTL